MIRQLPAESLLPAVAGGVVGVLPGKAALAGLVSLLPDTLPKWIEFSLDGRFGAFCAALTGAAANFFGPAPSLRAASATRAAHWERAVGRR